MIALGYDYCHQRNGRATNLVPRPLLWSGEPAVLQRTVDILYANLDQLAIDWVRAMNASLSPESQKAVPAGQLAERARTDRKSVV